MGYEGYFTKKELERRGWTIKMFADHLPEPHRKVPNPRSPAFAPMGLYDRTIVEKIEATPAFQDYMEWTQKKFRPIMREAARKLKERRASGNSD